MRQKIEKTGPLAIDARGLALRLIEPDPKTRAALNAAGYEVIEPTCNETSQAKGIALPAQKHSEIQKDPLPKAPAKDWLTPDATIAIPMTVRLPTPVAVWLLRLSATSGREVSDLIAMYVKNIAKTSTS